MAQRKHVPDMAKIYDALGPWRERTDLATVAAVMERLVAAAARRPPPTGAVKVMIVTNDTLASRRIALMSSRSTEVRGGRFTEVRDGVEALKEGIVHWDAPGDPIEGLTGIPSPPEPFPRTKRGRPPSADLNKALLVAVSYHGLTGEPPTRKWNARKRMETSQFYVFADVVFRELFGRTAPWSALHEACKRWERSRGFSKRDMQKQLFDNPKTGATTDTSAPAGGPSVPQYREFRTYLMQQSRAEETRAEGRRRHAYLQYRESGGTLRYRDWICAQSPPLSGASD
jgi:hypothetical protein